MLAQHGLLLERALWVAYRTVKERGILIRKMVEEAHATGSSSAHGFEERLRELEDQAVSIYQAIATLVEPSLDEQSPTADT
jgi:hypothetical protein